MLAAQVELLPAPVELKPVLRTLMNLYFYDLAEFAAPEDWNPDLRDDGNYPNRYFDIYWTPDAAAAGREAYLIRVNGLAAGHVYVNRAIYSGRADWALAEFFVLRKFRRGGVGREVAWKTFDLHPGRWEVAQTRRNLPAQAFWRKTIAEYLAPRGQQFDEFMDPGDWHGPVQVFRSRSTGTPPPMPAAADPFGWPAARAASATNAAAETGGVSSLRAPPAPPALQFRVATPADAPLLARMNRALIEDEHNRNPMSDTELLARMAARLDPANADRFEAAVFEADGRPVGYALYRRRPEDVFVQQFFVAPEVRRRGVARAALKWLQSQRWQSVNRVQLDVLASNPAAALVWYALGFQEYAMTLEREVGSVLE